MYNAAIMAAAHPTVAGFFHAPTGTVSYVVSDPATSRAAVIDSVLDFDQASGRTSTKSADAIALHVEDQKLTVDWILETHAHADHLSAAQTLRRRLGGTIAIGEHIAEVQRTFAALYGIPQPSPQIFDRRFADGERFKIGAIEAEVMHTPGHTPACVSYRVGDALFCGDTLFMPDYGTARCDFPGGSAETLYRSIRRLLALPPETRVFVNHVYPPEGQKPVWQASVAEQRAGNKHVRDGIGEAEFAEMRRTRDATLAMPQLLWPSIQVNIQAGQLPAPDRNGLIYLKLPLNAL